MLCLVWEGGKLSLTLVFGDFSLFTLSKGWAHFSEGEGV